MGSACAPCTIFDDPDIRDRRITNTEDRQQLISYNYPDPTRSLPQTPNDQIQSQQTGTSISDRLSMFEQNDRNNNNSKKTKKSKPKSKSNKPRKKWTVKGIDDKKKNSKKPINASSNIQSNINYKDEEPSMSMSHKDRMKLYEEDLVNVEEKEKQRMEQHKKSRGGYGGVQVNKQQKEMAKKLLEKRVETQKKGDINGIVLNINDNNNITLKSDDKNNNKKKKRTMNELLNEATSDDARNITLGMGLINIEYDNKEKRDMIELNMNNNTIMNRLLNEQKNKLISLIAYSIIDNRDKNKIIDKVLMCNASINDKLINKFINILCNNKQDINIKELWLESNPIGNDGINDLCKLIELNLDCLIVIKLYNNKKDISTSCCNQLIDSLEKNDKIIKFTFEFRLQQQRDRVDRLLKKNQKLRRTSKFKK